MRKFTKKQYLAAAAATVIVVGGAGAAFAYWTSSGTGTGSASTSNGETNTLTIQSSSAPSNMAPGVAAGAISGVVKNSGSANAYVTSVTVTIASVAKATGAPAGTCSASDYSLTNGTMSVGSDLAPNGTANFSGASLGFNNDPAHNQDACKGATVNLLYTINSN